MMKLSVRQAAERLGLSAAHVRRLCNSEYLPATLVEPLGMGASYYVIDERDLKGLGRRRKPGGGRKRGTSCKKAPAPRDLPRQHS